MVLTIMSFEMFFYDLYCICEYSGFYYHFEFPNLVVAFFYYEFSNKTPYNIIKNVLVFIILLYLIWYAMNHLFVVYCIILLFLFVV